MENWHASKSFQPTIPDSQGQTSCYKLSVELCFGSVASFITSALPLTQSKHESGGEPGMFPACYSFLRRMDFELFKPSQWLHTVHELVFPW